MEGLLPGLESGNRVGSGLVPRGAVPGEPLARVAADGSGPRGDEVGKRLAAHAVREAEGLRERDYRRIVADALETGLEVFHHRLCEQDAAHDRLYPAEPPEGEGGEVGIFLRESFEGSAP